MALSLGIRSKPPTNERPRNEFDVFFFHTEDRIRDIGVTGVQTCALPIWHHDVLAKQFCLTVPPWDKLSWFCDKRQLNKLARELKVDQPWTVYPRDREEVTQLRCSFPDRKSVE